MKVYSTTRIFDHGILVLDGCTEKVCGDARIVSKPGFWGILGKGVFSTEEEAQEDARRRVDKAMRALTKRMVRLKAMKLNGFPVKPG